MKISNWTEIKNNAETKVAEIDIEGVIGMEPWWDEEKKTTTKEAMKAELKAIANLDAQEIIVSINSYGGDVNHAVSMYDMLAGHKAKIHTEVHGHTASAATIIAQAGDTRSMSSTALYLVHQGQTVAMGTADDMEAGRKTLDTINNQIAEIYSKRSGRTVESMREVMDRNNGLGEWITADEALELGFIDEIKEPLAVAASVMPKPEALAVWNIPEVPKQKKGAFQMFDWLKNVLNLSPEQAEILDKMPESVENVKAEMQTSIDALSAEKHELSARIEELEGEVKAHAETAEKFENASKLAEEFSQVVVTLESEKKELEEKLEKCTAGVKPPVQDDSTCTDLVAMIKNRMDTDSLDYAKAAQAVFKDNPELHNKLVVSKRK
jgi:ATP-dependent protease ClpP protease subunit